MKVTVKRVKLAVALIALPLFALLSPDAASVRTRAAAIEDTSAATYKAKCAVCHGASAQKFFDLKDKTDEQLVEVVLKGKKGEKPPFMPAYEDKGIDAGQAKALVDYMKQLKASSSEAK